MSSVRKLTADELGPYAERLAETFGGARYKVAVAIWPVSGPVELAVAYVIDLHDSSFPTHRTGWQEVSCTYLQVRAI